MRAPLLLLLIALVASNAHALQGDIHHCVDASGHPVFTDRSCASMQATPAPAASSQAAASQPLAPLPVLCPATPEVLRQQVIDAFAAHDPNRMAGLMLWNGYNQREAVTQIQALEALMQAPLLDVGVDDAPPRPATQAAATMPEHTETPPPPADRQDALSATNAAPPGWLTVETTNDDASGGDTRTRFQMTAAAGCLWLRPAD